MSRSRASAKQAGSSFERLVADGLAEKLGDDRIDRRVKRGAADRGDVANVRAHGHRVVIECKDFAGRLEPAQWTREAEVERANDDALAGVVVAKRRGTKDPGQQWCLMTVDELVALISGSRGHIV